jgi:hypothetical protein
MVLATDCYRIVLLRDSESDGDSLFPLCIPAGLLSIAYVVLWKAVLNGPDNIIITLCGC